MILLLLFDSEHFVTFIFDSKSNQIISESLRIFKNKRFFTGNLLIWSDKESFL